MPENFITLVLSEYKLTRTTATIYNNDIAQIEISYLNNKRKPQSIILYRSEIEKLMEGFKRAKDIS